MTNIRTDEIVFFHNVTKISTDENKAIYSTFFGEGFLLKIKQTMADLISFLSLLVSLSTLLWAAMPARMMKQLPKL